MISADRAGSATPSGERAGQDDVNRISRHFAGRTKVLVGAEATNSAIKRAELGSYDHLHFATHGILGGEIAGLERPALVLAYEESENCFAGALRKGIDVHTLQGRAFFSPAGSQPSETHPAEVLETLLIPAGAANASPTASP